MLRLACLLTMLTALVVDHVAAASPRPARGRTAMAATAHPFATDAAIEVLREGGTAADAAVAAALVVGVAEPYSAGIGGGGFLLYYDAATGTTRVLDYRETAPAAATRTMFLDADGAPIPGASLRGHRAAGVPGMVAGLFALHERHGVLPRERVVAAAARIARDGAPVDDVYHEKAVREQALLGANAEAARIFLAPDGRVPDHGATFRQPELAATLEALGRGGAVAFYRGAIADAIADEMARGGGLITRDDLAAYAPQWREPIRGTYRGHEIVTMPPPSSGGVHLVQMLNVLEGWDVAAMGPGSSAAAHALAEVMRSAYADRATYLGDPAFVDVPVAGLTSKAYAAALRGAIDATGGRARRSAEVGPGDPRAFGGAEAAAIAAAAASEHTTHLCVVDGAGNAVTLTQSINYSWGCGVVVPGTGILLNNTMDDFAVAPGAPNAYGLVGDEANAIAPRKIPLSSMTPTLVFRDGRLWLAVGTPGGSRIITTVLHSIVNVVDHGLSVSEAINAPRMHHQWLPDVLAAEPRALPADVAEALRARGHDVREAAVAWSNAMAILVDPETGERFGAADVRGVGSAAGY